MLKILVVDGNSVELIDEARAKQQLSTGDHYGTTLAQLQPDLSFEVIEPYREARRLSADYLSRFDGAAFTGSGVSWSTSAVEAAPLRQTMEDIFSVGLPSFGSCNGLQLANDVLGGRNQASPKGFEIGLARDIRLLAEHAVHRSRRDGFSSLCVHRDQVAVPAAGAIVTAENAHSIQAMVYEQDGVRFWGVQYHPELELTHIADYLRRSKGIFAGRDALLAELEAACEDNSLLGEEALDLALPARTTELGNWLLSLPSQDSLPD
ncbi:MAG: type 1 glutamine amidotransferase [Granulosicoccaceae bacterium]